MKLTPKIIHSAATDAGNRNMRKNGRTIWDEDDFEAAARESERLYKLYDQERARAKVE